ncbi:AraC-like DNA-binding protein [Mobilisporobacter senegalensis]|uniref:AraC-like DNA-binding protein n=1 Tax=Mobilisporobacter senegalensis TaxID=1329262 RepID=A0A3N1XZ78_9FIRM|nr:helix-turn-helix domain-containing protein [Mobilisporobacter senegalensis]ROR30562.1 AraC-like DNA-binding protein [Mobilisporobacter senegalensis]
MFLKNKRNRLPLKTAYYMSFLFFIVIPILIVLVVVLMILNQQFKKQAIENIKRAQEAIIADLESDEDVMSMRLSHMVYTNDNEILKYAAGTDIQEPDIRNDYERKLAKAVNMALEPVKDIISVSFYMRDGKEIYVKNDITRKQEEIKKSKWYQAALEKSNTVSTGFYDTESTNDLYMGSKKDSLILVFALAPDVTTDRFRKIEMVMFFQSAGASERIKSYNQSYLTGKNKLGITQIIGTDGELVFSTQKETDFSSGEYTCVTSPIEFNNSTWYIENYIKTSELTADYWNTAIWVLGAAVLILMLAGYYSRYFLMSIVKPIEEISGGLRQVEEGNLEVHIASKGQFEIRNMIHQFNAMVRRLKVLVEEYEERIKSVENTPGDYFASILKGEMTPEEVNKQSKEFFMEHYAVLGFFVEYYDSKKNEADIALRLVSSFERNPRFVSRCIIYMESSELFLVFYRITEDDYTYKLIHMAEELQRAAKQEFDAQIFICIGQKKFGYAEFEGQIKEIREKICMRHLKGNNSIINLNEENERADRLLHLAKKYEKLAGALYIADEKNLMQEKEKMFELFSNQPIEEMKMQVYAAILAIGDRFNRDNISFSDVFGKQYDYIEKINRIEDARSLKLWTTNYFSWIVDYSATKLSVSKTDAIVKAKRYLADNYEDGEMSLKRVAEYVGLNEKYFTNRFTKETGETFSSYLTGLRIQKSQELLKTTNFKVYEIAEMVGYYNVEHFNRMFKKLNGISPARYRKTDD